MLTQSSFSLPSPLTKKAKRRAAALAYLCLAIGSGVGIIGKIDLLHRISHLPVGMLWVAVPLLLLAPLLWPLVLRKSTVIAPFFLLIFIVTALAIYPKVEGLHQIGRGSDQADCVIVASSNLFAGHWLYPQGALWSHNPMSCGPGWVMLQAPAVHFAGYPFMMLALWACVLFYIFHVRGLRYTSALISVLFLSMSIWLGVANGTDFLTFGMCVIALVLAAEQTKTWRLIFLVVSSFVAQFRVATIFLPLFWRRTSSRRIELASCLISIVFFLAFLAWRPYEFTRYGPLHVFNKFTGAVLPSQRFEVVLLVFVALTIGLLCCLLITRKVSGSLAVFGYLLFLFGIPSVLGLVHQLRIGMPLVSALGHWEGSAWLSACVPLATMILMDSVFAIPSTRRSEVEQVDGVTELA